MEPKIMDAEERSLLADINARLTSLDRQTERIERKLETLDGKFVSHDLFSAAIQRIAHLEDSRIKREEFAPIQKVVYGLAAAVGLAIVGALMTLILQK